MNTRRHDLPSRETSLQRLGAIGARIAARSVDAGFPEFWATRVAAAPNNVLIRTAKGSYTYADADRITDQIALAVSTRGIKAGDAVGIQLPSGTASLLLIIGLAKSGVRISLLSAALRGRSLAHVLTEIPTKLLFTTPVGEKAIHILPDFSAPQLAILSGLDDSAAALSSGAEAEWASVEAWLSTSGEPEREVAMATEPRHEPQPEDILFYIFTSGTTGLPKATQCSHGRYVSGGISEAALLDLKPEDRMYVVLPLFHIAALSAIGASISASASVFIRRKFSASQFWNDVHAYSLTTFQYLGEILRYLLAQPPSPKERPNTLRAMIGAGVTQSVWSTFEDRFGPVQIVESYGSSEGVIGIFNADGVHGSVGRAAPPLEARLRIVAYDVMDDELLRDQDGRLIVCDEGQPGELIARLEDRSQFEGYSEADATASKLIEGAFVDGDLWYRSGDLFRQVEGFYFFVSRLGDTYRWKGENVSAQEVADALNSLAPIAHAIVYPVQVPDHEGSAGMALVRLAHGGTFDGEQVYRELSAELPAHALPLFLRLGDGQAVLTETYKVGLSELKRQGYAPEHAKDPLYLLDLQARAYVPLSLAALTQAQLPPFLGANHD